ncbi:hypothetical protein OG216_34850 [Streptomycetaceae bacterium NBC_01309]
MTRTGIPHSPALSKHLRSGTLQVKQRLGIMPLGLLSRHRPASALAELARLVYDCARTLDAREQDLSHRTAARARAFAEAAAASEAEQRPAVILIAQPCGLAVLRERYRLTRDHLTGLIDAYETALTAARPSTALSEHEHGRLLVGR